MHGLSMIDLRKAFDLVHHQILLEKVELYGLGTTVVAWFQSNPISTTDIFKSKSVKFFPQKRLFNMISLLLLLISSFAYSFIAIHFILQYFIKFIITVSVIQAF